jgi:hypothetical protein
MSCMCFFALFSCVTFLKLLFGLLYSAHYFTIPEWIYKIIIYLCMLKDRQIL